LDLVMAAKRSHIPCATKLASALLTIVRPDETGKFVPVISYEEAQKLTAEQVISRFRFDHYPIPHAQGGPDHHSNLLPRPTAEHEARTAKLDIPQIAKTKRLSKQQEAFRARLLAKTEGEQASALASGGKQKISSAPFRKSQPQRTASRPLSRRTIERQT
jgi:hypothetical protein